jgi:HAE1 family hydrophobic/amphiphilic exporter-1
LTVAIAAVGGASFVRAPLDLLPEVDLPRLEIQLEWAGASPEMVESLVTSPVEAAAQSVRGVESITSTSYPGRATVAVEFTRDTDMEFVRLELSERLAVLDRVLPLGARRPLVEPYVPEAFAIEDEALLGYTLAGPATLEGLRDLAVRRIEPVIRAIEGVGAVETVGGSERVLQVRLDPIRLTAFGLSPRDVHEVIATTLDVSESGTTIRRGAREWTITIGNRAIAASDVEDLVLEPGSPSSPAIGIADVAQVALAFSEPHSHYRVDGESAVTLFVHGEGGSNAIRVADRVREGMNALTPRLPAGFRLIEDYDRTRKIRAEVSSLRSRAVFAAVFVFLVLLVAFRRFAPAAIACGSIAASVFAAVALIRAAGLSFNLLTLAGLAMGIGLVVDNAIVVLESIDAHRARGKPSLEAAERGTREVMLPVLAATTTTVIVFVPFLYAQGELRAYYVSFAWTVAAILAASLVISLTSVPALAAMSDVRRTTARQGVKDPGGEAESSHWGRALRRLLAWTVRYPKATASAVSMLLALGGWLFWDRVPRGRTWFGLGEETFLSIQIEMPPGTELGATDEVARGMEEKLDRIPEVDRYVTRVHAGFGQIHVTFPNSIATTNRLAKIKERLVAHSHEYGGSEVRVYGFGPSFYGGTGGSPSYSLKLLGYDYRELERVTMDLAARLQSFSRVRAVNPNASGPWFERDQQTEFILKPDRDRLAARGLSVGDLVDQVLVLVQGRLARDHVEVASEDIPLEVKIQGSKVTEVEDLMGHVVAGAEDRAVRIGDVAEIHRRETLGRIVREDQRYQRIVTWEFRGPSKLGDRVRDAVIASTVLPAGFTIEKERAWWEEDRRELRNLMLVLGLAVTLVYLVTAALFESLRAPVVILVAVPQALIGVFILYWALGETFTREAWIGVVMMSGIVVNNAILLVDRIRRRARGDVGTALSLERAAVEGALDRVRPILMTTGTAILGLLPLVVSVDEGASTMWRALSLTTIGGLTASTLFVVTTIPSFYVLIMRRED